MIIAHEKRRWNDIFQRLFLIFIDSSFISFQYQRIQRSSQQKPLSPLC